MVTKRNISSLECQRATKKGSLHELQRMCLFQGYTGNLILLK